MPGSYRLHLHPAALRAQVHGEWNLQHALVHHKRRTDDLARRGPDRESGGVLDSVLGGLAPGPGLAGQDLRTEPAFNDKRNAGCKR